MTNRRLALLINADGERWVTEFADGPPPKWLMRGGRHFTTIMTMDTKCVDWAKKQDLYFFFNPYTGLIKIGIAGDADLRRRQLEFACGVRLETLAVFPGQWWYEERLHEAFTESRQVGEWFVPTRDLMDIIAGAESFDALLTRYADRIAGYRAVAAAQDEERKERHRDELAREKERLAAVRAEERRIKREEAQRAELRLVR